MTPTSEPGRRRRIAVSFQTRLTLTLLAAAIIPLGIFGIILIASGTVDSRVGSRPLVSVRVKSGAGRTLSSEISRALHSIPPTMAARTASVPAHNHSRVRSGLAAARAVT